MDSFERRLKELHEKLVEEFHSEISEEEISKKIDLLKIHITDAFDEGFSDFENFAYSHLFRIPNFVLMAEHQMFIDGNQWTEVDEEKISQRLQILCDRNKELRLMNELMKAELKELDLVDEFHNELLKRIKELRQALEQKTSDNEEKRRLVEEFFSLLHDSSPPVDTE